MKESWKSEISSRPMRGREEEYFANGKMMKKVNNTIKTFFAYTGYKMGAGKKVKRVSLGAE